ncbi:Chromosomal replication initiator [Candidatus Terasakiella magnetica]|nr:Chromosomal replication initiator [Candidatus Terasakiella magnetica]
MTEVQLPLDFGHCPALSEGDFLVAPCNEAAWAWLERWPNWPTPALAVYGPAGSGKTHLAHIFAQTSAAVFVDVAAMGVEDPPRLLEAAPVLILEDCDRVQLNEVALFHLVNLARETGRTLLLTGRLAPSAWPIVLADLRSRLNAMTAIGIGAPDDAILAAVLVKLFADRQIRIAEDVILYLLGRMERSFAAALGLVDRLDRAALSGGRAVTVPLARAILDRGER